MTNDDRHPLVRFFSWVEVHCPWLHLILLALAVGGSIALHVLLGRLLGAKDLIALCTGMACCIGCIFYANYVYELMKTVRRRKEPVMAVEVRSAGCRREVYRRRGKDLVLCYGAFKPLDGSPAIDLRIPEMEHDRHPAGTVGILRYQADAFLSFTPKGDPDEYRS